MSEKIWVTAVPGDHTAWEVGLLLDALRRERMVLTRLAVAHEAIGYSLHTTVHAATCSAIYALTSPVEAALAKSRDAVELLETEIRKRAAGSGVVT